MVCDFKGRARIRCPPVIVPFTAEEICRQPEADRANLLAARNAKIAANDIAIAAWKHTDLKAQEFIVRYLDDSELTHVMKCDFAFQMWDA